MSGVQVGEREDKQDIRASNIIVERLRGFQTIVQKGGTVDSRLGSQFPLRHLVGIAVGIQLLLWNENKSAQYITCEGSTSR